MRGPPPHCSDCKLTGLAVVMNGIIVVEERGDVGFGASVEMEEVVEVPILVFGIIVPGGRLVGFIPELLEKFEKVILLN